MDRLTLFAAALPIIALAAVLFRRTRARVRETMRACARRTGGRVARSAWYLYPRLVVPFDGAEAQITCVHGSSEGGSARTFAWVGCDGYPGGVVELRRVVGREGFLERMGWSEPDTGDREFDAAFRVKGASDTPGWLDADLRRAMLAPAARRALRVRLGEATAFVDGRQRFGRTQRRLDVSVRALPPGREDLEQLVVIAGLAHERLVRESARRSA